MSLLFTIQQISTGAHGGLQHSNLGKVELQFPELPSINGSRSKSANRGIYLRFERRSYSSSCCSLKSLLTSWLAVVTDTDTAGFQLILTPHFGPCSALCSKYWTYWPTRTSGPSPDTEVAFEKYLMTDQCIFYFSKL